MKDIAITIIMKKKIINVINENSINFNKGQEIKQVGDYVSEGEIESDKFKTIINLFCIYIYVSLFMY